MATLPTMIAIPAGAVERTPLGADGKALTRSVALQPFEIGRTWVTRAEYDGIADPASAASAGASLPAHPGAAQGWSAASDLARAGVRTAADLVDPTTRILGNGNLDESFAEPITFEQESPNRR